MERDPFDLAAAILIGLIVIAWVSGFDILYACQDAEFDREHGLRSIPAAIGIKWAMQLARVNHVVMLLFLTVLPLLVPGLGYVYFTGVLLSGGLWSGSIGWSVRTISYLSMLRFLMQTP